MAGKRIEAFIFDLDGVITDTAEYHYRAWKRLAEEEGLSFSRADNEKLRGVSRRQSLLLILKDFRPSEEKIEEMMARKNGYYQSFLEQITEADFLPGARELLFQLKSQNYQLALASASKNAPQVISRLKIEHIFDTISDGNSVQLMKPAPDLFLHTAKKLDVPPEDCVVIEDARSGIDAALAAGMFAIGIGPERRVGHAHLRYERIAGMNLVEVLSTLQGGS